MYTHFPSAVIYTDILSFGAQWLSPFTLHPKQICTFTPGFSPLCCFPHTCSSQHTQPKTSLYLWTFCIPGHLPSSDPQCTNISVLTEPEMSPPSQVPPGICWRRFAAIPHRAGCRPMYEWGGSGHLAAPVQGCLAHTALHQWPESGFPYCPPGHCTDILGTVQRVDDSCCLRGQVFPTQEGGGLAKGSCLFFLAQGWGNIELNMHLFRRAKSQK